MRISLHAVVLLPVLSLPLMVGAVPTTLSYTAVTEFVLEGSGLPATGATITGSVVFDFDPANYTKPTGFPFGPNYADYAYAGAPYLWSARA